MLLGIDMGSSSCKAAVFTENGELKEVVSQPYGNVGIKDGLVEMPAEGFWLAFQRAVARIAADWGKDISAIAVSSHGETAIPVDENGAAVHFALMNADNRGVQYSQALETALGRERIYSITGLPAHPMYSLAKMLYFENRYPEKAGKVWKYCTVPDYLHLRLGITPRTDETLASRFMAFDIHTRKWSDEILTAAGMDRGKLWDTAPSGTYLGEITDRAAGDLGLPAGTKVFVGGHDQPCGVLGSGLSEHGMALSAGTYECLCAVSSRPLSAAEGLPGSFNSYCHVLPGQYITLGFFPAAAVLDWYLGLLFPREENRYAVLDSLESGEPTGILLTPHLIGACNPHWNPSARGAVYGLSLETKPLDIIKAVYEGMACELRLNLEMLEKFFGTPEEIRAFGGNVRGHFGAQLRADLTGKRIRRLDAGETVCRGAAILAGVGDGVFGDYLDASRHMSGSADLFVPDAARFARYSGQYARYTGIYSAMQSLERESEQ